MVSILMKEGFFEINISNERRIIGISLSDVLDSTTIKYFTPMNLLLH
jgi:hypothetical protein